MRLSHLGANVMGKKAWLLIAAIVAVLIVLILWIYRPQPQCTFSGWKKSVGVELDAEVKDLDSVMAKVGVNDAQVREFDVLMRDYALTESRLI